MSKGDVGFSKNIMFSKNQNLDIFTVTFSMCPKIQISKKSENHYFELYTEGSAAWPQALKLNNKCRTGVRRFSTFSGVSGMAAGL